MTNKQINQSREIRLWLTNIILPIGALSMLYPNLRRKVADKVIDIKDVIKKKFEGKENEEVWSTLTIEQRRILNEALSEFNKGKRKG